MHYIKKILCKQTAKKWIILTLCCLVVVINMKNMLRHDIFEQKYDSNVNMKPNYWVQIPIRSPVKHGVSDESRFTKMQKHSTLKHTEQKIADSSQDSSIFEPVGFDNGAAVFNLSHLPVDYALQFKDKKPMIPHIIHQIWDNYNIPVLFSDWIKSAIEKHPGWEYWFWTIDDARCLVQKHFPHLRQTFDSYFHPMFRADAFRYFALYKYGGIYFDLDVEVLKPLDFWTYFPAVISFENYEHSYLIHSLNKTNLMNTILASKKHHPFFLRLINNLKAHSYTMDILRATGPYFVHKIHNEYLTTNQSVQPDNGVLTIHPRYWLPKYDKILDSRSKCEEKYGNLMAHGKQLCDELKERNYTNIVRPDSFLDHHWVHSNLNATIKESMDTIHIQKLVPNVTLASSFMKC